MKKHLGGMSLATLAYLLSAHLVLADLPVIDGPQGLRSKADSAIVFATGVVVGIVIVAAIMGIRSIRRKKNDTGNSN
jgi:hypothetical protein